MDWRGARRARHTGRLLLATGALLLATGCGQPSTTVASSTKPQIGATTAGKGAGGKPGVSPTSHVGTSGTHPSVPATQPTQMPDATGAFQTLGGQAVGSAATSGGNGASVKPSAAQPNRLSTQVQHSHLRPSEQRLVAPYVAKLIGLQAAYTSQLYSLYDAARAQYHQGAKGKAQIEQEYLPKVLAMENSAQDQLNALLFALRSKLIAAGYDTSVIDSLRNDYYQEVSQVEASLGR